LPTNRKSALFDPPARSIAGNKGAGAVHQIAIDLQTFADIHDDMTVHSRTDTGAFLVTCGTHPELGSVVAIQDMEPGILMFSETPAYWLRTLLQSCSTGLGK
jgi:hypothetical protein